MPNDFQFNSKTLSPAVTQHYSSLKDMVEAGAWKYEKKSKTVVQTAVIARKKVMRSEMVRHTITPDYEAAPWCQLQSYLKNYLGNN